MSGDTAAALRRTALYEAHLSLGARMVPFAGWEMPVQYRGVIEEHMAVRQRTGMFDVSHMGRFELHGAGAGPLLRYLCTWDVMRLAAGEGHYATMCREDGGILDDVYVFALEPSPSPSARYLVVVNAANAAKIKAWIESHIGGFQARLIDRHAATAMIAVQGPKALDVTAAVAGEFVRSLRPRHCAEAQWRDHTLFASRTGYTGEDGLELVIDAAAGRPLWDALLAAGVVPCGLGARDTLRLEAALLLYGNDIDEGVNPWEAGLGWVVSLDDGADFVGREALLKLREAGLARQLVCLRATGRGIMRAGCPVLLREREVGKVTSGGYSPTLAASIGLAFVPPYLAPEGTELMVGVRGKPLPVRVVPRPFYRRPK